MLMAERFLSPPQGPTSLRAPRIDEGTDVLGNVAGNDPNILGKIAQLLLKLREPAGLATAAIPISGPGRALSREAAYFTGTNVRPPGGLPPAQETLDAQRVNVGKNALTGFLQELANMKRSAELAEARKPYVPNIADYMPAPPASSFGKPSPPIPSVVQPTVNPNRMQRLPHSSTAIGAGSVAGPAFDPRGATLTQEEIQAIFKATQPTVQPPDLPKPPGPGGARGRKDPRIGRAAEDAAKKRKEQE